MAKTDRLQAAVKPTVRGAFERRAQSLGTTVSQRLGWLAEMDAADALVVRSDRPATPPPARTETAAAASERAAEHAAA